MFIGIFAILHCSHVPDILENEQLVNDLCMTNTTLHKENDPSLTLWGGGGGKRFTKLGKVEEEHLTSRNACRKAVCHILQSKT